MTTPVDEDEFSPQSATSYRELEKVDDGNGQEIAVAHAGMPAYTQYSREMISLVGKSIMPARYKPEELYYVLELAATYRLDPLTKELWAVRMSDNLSDPVIVMVGVEGLKKIASRDPAYRGFRVSEVYANDTFEGGNDVRRLEDGSWTQVTHRFSLAADRGDLLGAYCEVYREGWPPAYFWAPLDEYLRTGTRTPWNKQKTAMIRKCAIANGLRQCYQVSGLYIEDEMAGGLRNGAPALASGTTTSDDDWPTWDDEWREQRVKDLFAAIEEAKPGSYMRGKQKLEVASAETDEARDELLARLEREIQDAGGVLPDPPEAQTGEVVDDGAADDVPFGDDEPPESAQESLPVE